MILQPAQPDAMMMHEGFDGDQHSLFIRFVDLLEFLEHAVGCGSVLLLSLVVERTGVACRYDVRPIKGAHLMAEDTRIHVDILAGIPLRHRLAERTQLACGDAGTDRLDDRIAYVGRALQYMALFLGRFPAADGSAAGIEPIALENRSLDPRSEEHTSELQSLMR